MKHVHAVLTGIALCCIGAFAHAQTYPTKPIRRVVPYGPGSTNILARVIAPKVGAALGQQIVVENRPGAGGSVGSEQVAKGAADGYTILMGTAASHAVNPALYSKVGYDAAKDFAPAATPEPVVRRLNREFALALADADIRDNLMAQGYTINGGSPQDLGALVRSE